MGRFLGERERVQPVFQAQSLPIVGIPYVGTGLFLFEHLFLSGFEPTTLNSVTFKLIFPPFRTQPAYFGPPQSVQVEGLPLADS